MAPISTYNNSTPWTSMQDPNDGPHSTYNNNTAVQNTLRPGYVQYQPGYNSSMALAPEIDKRLAAIGPINTAGLDKFRGEAMRSGPSAWSQLALGQNTQREHDAMDAGATSVGSRNAEALSALSSGGRGLSAGARERATQGSSRNMFNMQQGIGRQADQNAQQIGINDEQNRISQLGSLPGMEAQSYNAQLDPLKLYGQARQGDVSNQLQENKQKNLFDMNKYQADMQGWAANQQANATATAGDK